MAIRGGICSRPLPIATRSVTPLEAPTLHGIMPQLANVDRLLRSQMGMLAANGVPRNDMIYAAARHAQSEVRAARVQIYRALNPGTPLVGDQTPERSRSAAADSPSRSRADTRVDPRGDSPSRSRSARGSRSPAISVASSGAVATSVVEVGGSPPGSPAAPAAPNCAGPRMEAALLPVLESGQSPSGVSPGDSPARSVLDNLD